MKGWNGVMIFDDDICLCASKECPRYKECLRGDNTKRKGIYTIALLRECCNQNNDYEMFIKMEERND